MALEQVRHQIENWQIIVNGFVMLSVINAVATEKLIGELVVQNFIRHSEGVHNLRWKRKITNVNNIILLIYNMAEVDCRKRNFLIHKASSVEDTESVNELKPNLKNVLQLHTSILFINIIEWCSKSIENRTLRRYLMLSKKTNNFRETYLVLHFKVEFSVPT